MWYFKDTMQRQWSPCFLILAMLLMWHHITQYSINVSYATLCQAGGYLMIYCEWWATTDLESVFYSQGFFTLHPFLLSQEFPGACSSTSKLAGLHVDFQNIASARLFDWITTIYKRFICGRFYLKVKTG